ncbi:hypothetical protein [Woeseia oceani]|uniref:Phage shock protein B n=1 Tax=Woeseia oceani TaxID=1548547 RepID=A0A193LCQ0_9GAMM|nr:hypothetical protein [Woeseia oceani]ANO50216.1 hypothetical protein BA177_02370 [Woeseia oceani]
MNGVFTFVVLLAAIVLSARLIETWLKQRAGKAEADESIGETLEKIDRLEERIRVLERIVTENRVDLKQQIDNL